MLRNLPSASSSKRNSLKVLTRATKGLSGSVRGAGDSRCGKSRPDLERVLSERWSERESLMRVLDPVGGRERRFEFFER